MNAESITYTCCICGREGVTKWYPNPMFTLAKWGDKLACNPCADFTTKKNRIVDRILRIAYKLSVARKIGLPNLQDIERVALEKLTAYSRDFAKVICDRNNIEMVWEQDFPQQIFEKPELAVQHLKFYARGMASVAANAKKQPKETLC